MTQQLIAPASNALTHRTQHQSIPTLKEMWIAEKFAKSRSIKTRDDYDGTLSRFEDWLGQFGGDLRYGQGGDEVELGNLANALRAWMVVIYDRVDGTPRTAELTNATISHRLAVVSSFYRFAMRQPNSGFRYNPVEYVERPPVKSRPNKAKAFSVATVERVLNQIDNTKYGKRDRAFILMALATGRRAAELLSLNIGDLQETDKGIVADFRRIKGGKQATHVLESRVVAAVSDYVRFVYADGYGDADPLFRSLSNSVKGVKRWDYNSLRYMFDKRFGTSKVHSSRHTVAVILEGRGVDRKKIQHILSHESYSTTEKYLEDVSGDVVDINPLEGIITE